MSWISSVDVMQVYDVFMFGLGIAIEALFISIAFALFVNSLCKLARLIYALIARRYDELDP